MKLPDPKLDGEFYTGPALWRIYSTDASEFQELPAAVAFPANERDVQRLILYAREQKIGLIPRAAGTSLAGQVVGAGIVVDVGKYLNRVIEVSPASRSVRVQPGVVRNELNQLLACHGLFFAPETSTANRAMIGGMVGNNSCGANSIVYGSTREHLLRLRGFLSDGSQVEFGPLCTSEFSKKCSAPDSLETRIYRGLHNLLNSEENQRVIAEGFPKPTVTRRNTGYALDALLNCEVFRPGCGQPFNLCKLLAGSEGTLVFAVELELHCEQLPPPPALLCAHFHSLDEALRATLIAVRHAPSACELIDKHILDCARKTAGQTGNRFFLIGDPAAVLVIEQRRACENEARAIFAQIERDLREAGLGYAWPVVFGNKVQSVWELRRAGQAVMTNVTGDAKPAEVVEDTAVAVEDLPDYIRDFEELMRAKFGVSCVYYGHAGAGELHTRPTLNLKTHEGHRMFREIAQEVANLVKKYRGSLSGEHGDGRLRGEFIEKMVGPDCYRLMKQVKQLFDPAGIFNPGKIIDAPAMDCSLRYSPGQPTPEYRTIFDFSDSLGILRAAEKCNGCGECRKSHLMGGTMCPSFMVTRNEKDSTRARANLLRQFLTEPPDGRNPFASYEIKEVLDLCLSCKACKAECPTNVDMAKLKAEFLQHYYDANGVPLREWMIAHFASVTRLASFAPELWNFLFSNPVLRRVMNRLAGFHPQRSIPAISSHATVQAVVRRPRRGLPVVYFFFDEFSQANDVHIALAAVELLEAAGRDVVVIRDLESGRAALSKGLLRRARHVARKNVSKLSGIVSEASPLVGIEPSAILAFRDEYPELLRGAEHSAARALAPHCLLVEEFLCRQLDAGNLPGDLFEPGGPPIHLHGHCQQKAVASLAPTIRLFEEILLRKVCVIPSGCCGMAGAFGYEREHFALSMQIGELVLFPYIRELNPEAMIAASGTSCRHQIIDGTGRTPLHPIQILHHALRKNNDYSGKPRFPKCPAD